MIKYDSYEKDSPVIVSEYNDYLVAELNESYFKKYAEGFSELTFGDILQILRKDLNANSENLANASGVSRPYISQIENNYKLPSNKLINKIAIGLTEILINHLNDKEVKSENNNFGKEIETQYKRLLIEAKNKAKSSKLLGDNSKIKLTEQEIKLLNDFRSMSNEDRKLVVTLADRLRPSKISEVLNDMFA